jgi:hypothetical protein
MKIEGLERDFEDRMEGVMEKKMDEMERYQSKLQDKDKAITQL